MSLSMSLIAHRMEGIDGDSLSLPTCTAHSSYIVAKLRSPSRKELV